MENFSKFSLLRLPFIPMEKTMQLMDIDDQYRMADVSKKAERLVALSLSRKAYTVTVSINKEIFIIIRNIATKEYFKITFENNGPEGYISMDSLRSHVKTIRNVFNPQITRLSFQTGRPRGFEDRLISIFEEYLVISNIIVFPTIDLKPDDELYSIILNKCFNINHLDIELTTTAEFKLPVSKFPMLHCNHLSLDNAGWVTGDHLTNFMNVKDLIMRQTQFNSKDMNKFINSWVNGSRIEYANFHRYGGFNFTEIFNGIDIREEDFISTKFRRFKKGEAFVVKQATGKEAIVYEDRDELYLDTNFSRASKKPKTM